MEEMKLFVNRQLLFGRYPLSLRTHFSLCEAKTGTWRKTLILRNKALHNQTSSYNNARFPFTRLNEHFVQKKLKGKSILFLDGYSALENIIETLQNADHEKLLLDRNYGIYRKLFQGQGVRHFFYAGNRKIIFRNPRNHYLRKRKQISDMEISPVLPITGQNLLQYFDGYLEFLALLQNFVFYSTISRRNSNGIFRNPGWETIRQVIPIQG